MNFTESKIVWTIDKIETILIHSIPKNAINCLTCSGDSKHFLFKQTKNLKNHPPGGLGGVPRILLHPNSYFFCDSRPHIKFQNPTLTPSGRKISRQKERREKEEKCH
jgi:hypothetical protein